MRDKKKIRETVGYTQKQLTADPAVWYRTAKSFNAAANLLHEFQSRVPGDSRPFVMNAALSLELILKSILAKNATTIPDGADGHNLCALCERAKVGLSEKQMTTLELLTETIIWAGRYPGPKNEKRWDDYQDRILEKHIVRSTKGNVSSTVANRETFPTWENYKKIWESCVAEFQIAG
jgi:HEPN domain-containing protein